ncbi:hypothetical protein FNF29_05728 [Cafeteria roenbergensis]|uniref:Proline dehydrogenase n=1 Tax=Cafeteria roenbergensis TaxID=33653 RepID=A0A5A8CAM7_CAFRO|nr:hypothetical protein FNF29_05728 [Cafeteria roenbergensis]|eukprot:KAA0149717.1 hypothetical protein FNF29_05728 [Cafeteria roenbergensis]
MDEKTVAPPDSKLQFDDVKAVYGGATRWELLRAILVFRVSQVDFLVQNARKLITLSRKVFGDTITDAVLQATFFGHFCAGRSAEEIQPVLQRLQKDGVGSILDYAAEDEIEEKAQRHLGVSRDQIQVRTYDYQGEEQCDFNLEVTLRSIDTAAQLSKVTGLPGFAAVKVTSIGKPELLQHISQAMSENRSLFLRQFLGEDTSHIGPEGQGSSDDSDEDSEVEISALAGGLVDNEEAREAVVAALRSDAVSNDLEQYALGEMEHAPGQMDLLVGAAEVAAAAAEGQQIPLAPGTGKGPRLCVNLEEFVEAINSSGVNFGRSGAEELFHEIDADGSGSIDMLEWVDFMSTQRLASQPLMTQSPINPDGDAHKLDQDEMRRLNRMLDRARALSDAAREKGVTIMFDAEQTYLQSAIDHVVTRAQVEFNTERAVVYNTYQAYLRDAGPRIALDLERSRRRNFKFGAKLVRGAYMVQERKRAKELGYRDPIQPTLAATHASYNRAWKTILNEIKSGSGAEVMVATHNERSVRGVVDRMEQLGIERGNGGVAFGQLLGMCDHVSLSLGHAGYAVYKYVPYGPIKDVMPYLVRRAEENSGMLTSAGNEMRMRADELRRRPLFG